MAYCAGAKLAIRELWCYFLYATERSWYTTVILLAIPVVIWHGSPKLQIKAWHLFWRDFQNAAFHPSLLAEGADWIFLQRTLEWKVLRFVEWHSCAFPSWPLLIQGVSPHSRLSTQSRWIRYLLLYWNTLDHRAHWQSQMTCTLWSFLRQPLIPAGQLLGPEKWTIFEIFVSKKFLYGLIHRAVYDKPTCITLSFTIFAVRDTRWKLLKRNVDEVAGGSLNGFNLS